MRCIIISMKFVDPKNDISFKMIFGDENHKEVKVT